MEINNKMVLTFSALSQNESFARTAVSCFALSLNPSVSQIADIKTAVSEAVTNSIVHAYPNEKGDIRIETEINDGKIHIKIIDFGVGIDNVNQAIEPFYTTKPDDERSGMGFTIMKSFMDDIKIESKVGSGTVIYMVKNIANV